MRTLAAIAVLMFVNACQGPPPAAMTEAELAQIQADVMSWADQWIESSRSLDVDGVMALLDPDETRYAMNASFYSGRDECRGALEALYRGWETFDSSWSGRSVEALGPEVAFLIGQVRGPLTLADGTEGINQVRLAFLLKKRADGWRATYTHGSGAFTPNPTEVG